MRKTLATLFAAFLTLFAPSLALSAETQPAPTTEAFLEKFPELKKCTPEQITAAMEFHAQAAQIQALIDQAAQSKEQNPAEAQKKVDAATKLLEQMAPRKN